jgi:hypothetical protein
MVHKLAVGIILHNDLMWRTVMKKTLVILTMLWASAASAHLNKDLTYRFAGDIDYAGFCKAIVTNDVDMLKRNVKNKVGQLASRSEEVLRILISENGIKCNGIDLIEFSKQREANEVYAYLTSEG